MSASLRRHRVTVYAYSDTGTQGLMQSTYTVRDSGDADEAWWAAKVQPTGREATLVRKADHRVDAVFDFAAECPVAQDDALVCDGTTYLVRAVLVRDYGRDTVQVLAERTTDDLGIP